MFSSLDISMLAVHLFAAFLCSKMAHQIVQPVSNSDVSSNILNEVNKDKIVMVRIMQ